MCLKCLCAVVYYILQAAIFVVLPFVFFRAKNSMIVYDHESGIENEIFFSHGLYFASAILVLVTLPSSLLAITQHWLHYSKPHLQRPIIRILWIVPIWTATSWTGMWQPDYAITLDTCRECYEAYGIYQFTVLMSNYLHAEQDLGEQLARQPPVPHFLVLKRLMAPWYKGRPMAYRCKYGILQYAVVRIITTIIALNCELKSVYSYANHTLLLINLTSKGIVVYCLIFFYLAHVDELQAMKPLPKLICIKFVVFFSFLINSTVMILSLTGYIHYIVDVRLDLLKATTIFHDFLICVEMFAATLAFHCVFNYNDYDTISATRLNDSERDYSRDATDKDRPLSSTASIQEPDEPLLSFVY